MDTEPVVLELAGHPFEVTNPNKVFFTQRGDTKLDLVNFYRQVEGPIMAAMGGRPVLLQRFPNGASGKSFFQKRVPEKRPDWLATATVSTPNGTESEALVIEDIAHVIWAVNLGCLGFHVWPAKAADLDHADELRIDLDPTPGVGFDQIREAAHEVRAAAVALARELERRRPDLLTAAWWKEERGERVFIDYNQNAPHKTIFGAWSVRPRVGAQVSTPITWDEVAAVMPDELTIATVPARVAERGDPWADMVDHLQSIESLLAWSERDMAAGLMDAPWPPVYPKQPNEPPRVAPSRAKKDPDQPTE